MPNLFLEILLVLKPILSPTNIRHLSHISKSIFGLSNKVSLLGISRICVLSLRSIERFYAQKDIPWLGIRVLLFQAFFFKSSGTYLLVADEVVQKKSGKCTYGLSKFYSSLAGKVVPSVSFLGLSLVSVDSGQSHFLSCSPLLKNKSSELTQEPASKPSKQSSPSPGRPKGSKNKGYQEPDNLSFQSLKRAMTATLSLLFEYCLGIKVPYLVADGFYGHLHYFKLAQSKGLKLITKLRHKTALIYPYQGVQKPKGRHRIYGKKVDYNALKTKDLVDLPEEHPFKKKGIKVFAFQARHRKIKGYLLHVVIIQKYDNKNKRIGQKILVSDDLSLSALEIIKYYGLRFQIEFDFRDVKQFFGLAHFRNIKENQVKNVVNMAFTCKIMGQIFVLNFPLYFSLSCHYSRL